MEQQKIQLNTIDDVNKLFESFIKDAPGHIRNAGQQFISDFQTFVNGVDFTEPWLIGVLTVELILVITVVLYRRNFNVQGTIFFSVAFFLFCLAPINRQLALNWFLFSRRPYFDQNGLFISTIIGAPLLFVELIVLINYFMELFRVMVQVKAKQLKREWASATPNQQHDTATTPQQNPDQKKDQ